MILASLLLMSQTETFLAPGAKIEKIAEGLRFTEGPVEQLDSSLLFSDIPANRIYQIKDGEMTVWREPSGQSNGHTLDFEGRVVSAEHQTRRVTRTEADGTVTVLADKYEGKRLNSPNDVTVRKDGAIFFTDPPYGTPQGQKDLEFNGVFAIIDGKLKKLTEEFNRPNGLVFSVDQKTLYVADTAAGAIKAFDVAEDGTLSNGREFAKTPNPDGLRIDSDGRVWSASRDGVNVISPEGKVLEVIPMPEQPTNLCFSRDGKTLYVTTRTTVHKVAVRVKGIAP